MIRTIAVASAFILAGAFAAHACVTFEMGRTQAEAQAKNEGYQFSLIRLGKELSAKADLALAGEVTGQTYAITIIDATPEIATIFTYDANGCVVNFTMKDTQSLLGKLQEIFDDPLPVEILGAEKSSMTPGAEPDIPKGMDFREFEDREIGI